MPDAIGRLLARRAFLRAMGLGAATLSAPRWTARAAAPARPNIVFILADDLGWGDPRCNNSESKVPTPHMDRLAAQGVRFTDAHSGAAVCTPTRYGIVTGRYSWRTSLKRGVLNGYSAPLVEPGRATVASLLRAQGYRTGCVGKWHLGWDWARKDPNRPAAEKNIDFAKPIARGPLAVGFDYYFGISASLDMAPYVYVENDRVTRLPTAHQEKWGIVRPGAKAPDFDFFEVLPTLTRKATGFLDEHAAHHAGRPFFLYFPLTAPHTPVVPAKAFTGRSQAGEYGDFVAQVDGAIGEIVQALDRLGQADNTLLIVTSDNGSANQPMTEYDHRPNGPWRGRKSTIWEGGHREPFLARWPGRIAAGTTSDELVGLMDLTATCAAVAGAQLPPDAAEDSHNILPALLGEQRDRPIREALVHHSGDGMFAIRQGQWKLVLGRGSGGWDGKGQPSDPEGQLYDMRDDPAETTNLYERHPEVVARLTALLEKYQRDSRSRP